MPCLNDCYYVSTSADYVSNMAPSEFEIVSLATRFIAFSRFPFYCLFTSNFLCYSRLAFYRRTELNWMEMVGFTKIDIRVHRLCCLPNSDVRKF